jgi:hypothetical protein
MDFQGYSSEVTLDATSRWNSLQLRWQTPRTIYNRCPLVVKMSSTTSAMNLAYVESERQLPEEAALV